jgi:hypothetical protein
MNVSRKCAFCISRRSASCWMKTPASAPVRFDAFRLLQELVTVPEDEREAMFFGGLFAYDLVAGLKICRKPSRATAARTTASIWPKPCW